MSLLKIMSNFNLPSASCLIEFGASCLIEFLYSNYQITISTCIHARHPVPNYLIVIMVTVNKKKRKLIINTYHRLVKYPLISYTIFTRIEGSNRCITENLEGLHFYFGSMYLGLTRLTTHSLEDTHRYPLNPSCYN